MSKRSSVAIFTASAPAYIRSGDISNVVMSLIDEIIKEIEIRHGLVSFPARGGQEEYELE